MLRIEEVCILANDLTCRLGMLTRLDESYYKIFWELTMLVDEHKQLTSYYNKGIQNE